MLSLFPELLTYGAMLTPFFLRIVLGFYLFNEGWELLFRKNRLPLPSVEEPESSRKTGTHWFVGILELGIGSLLVIGLFTQLAAIIGMCLALLLAQFTKTKPHLAPHERQVYHFIFVICLSLLFLGAGAFGFDLPI